MTNPLDGFTVNRADIGYVGHELQRPECILAEPDGTLWSADARGGVMRIGQDGSQRFIGQQADARFGATASQDAEAVEQKFTTGTLPNGLAFAANGDILISNFGTDVLEVMTRDGATRLLADTIDGQPIGKVNFVLRDAQGRIWITVSTRMNPWTQAAGTRVRDGYVAVLDGTGLYVVADGFHFTNEIRLDAAGEWLYIVETTGPHITRMRVDGTGARVRLTDREVFGPSHLGGFPDGIAFDAYGNLWCTLVMVDQLIALTPQGDKRVLLDDGNPEPSQRLLDGMANGYVSPESMLAARGSIAPWMASVTFGGPDLRTVYLGSLMGTRIPFFRAPVAGLPLAHWH
ncbi:MAG: SMP-30/gluconolactonase/LRE family protein [Giesbergeria sp.]|jgi:gluconolactonase